MFDYSIILYELAPKSSDVLRYVCVLEFVCELLLNTDSPLNYNYLRRLTL